MAEQRPAHLHPPAARSVGSAIALLALLVGLAPASFAPAEAVAVCDLQWTGTESDSWHDEENWNPERLPTEDDTVCIDADENLPVVFATGSTTIGALQNNSFADLGTRLRIEGGELTVTSNSLLEGDYGVTIAGGTLSNHGTFTLEGPFAFVSGTLTGSGTMAALGGAAINGGTRTVAQPLSLDGTSTLVSAQLLLEDGAVLRNLGELGIRASTIAGDGEVVNEPDAAIRDNGATAGSRIEVPYVNRGYLRIQSRTLELTGGGVHEGVYGGTFESNYIDVVSSGTLEIFSTSGDPFTVRDGAQVFVIGNGTVSVRAGELIVESSSFDSAFPAGENGNIVTSSFGTLVADADLDIGNLRIGRHGLDGSGDILVHGGGFFTDRTSWSDGTIRGQGSTELRYLVDLELTGMAGDRVLGPGRTVVVEGDLVDATPATSTSTLTIQSGTSFEVTGDVVNDRVDIALAGTLSAATHTFGDHVQLTGSGSLIGDLRTSGTVAPGDSPGTLHVAGDYEQLADGTLEIELAGTSAGQFDRLEVDGDAELDGTLTVELVGGFEPAIGDRFEILTAATVTGGFADEDLPELDGAATMFVVYEADRVSLVVTDGSQPDPDQPDDPPAPPTEDEEPGVTPDPEQDPDDPIDVTDEPGEETVVELDPPAVGDDDAASTLPATGTSPLRGPLLLAILLMGAGGLLLLRRGNRSLA